MLESVLGQIEKQHGKGSIMKMGQTPVKSVPAISTGSLLINNALGIDGFPRGRVVEIYGPESSGKTTIALQAIAQAQKNKGACAFIDAEHAFDPSYAAKLGIDLKDLIMSQPDYGEQALDIVEMLVRSGAIDIIVVDSVAALVPKSELEGDMGDSHMGLQARLMSQALRKLTPAVHKSKTSIVFINQVRQNIGTMGFGPKETTTGGNALKFYASLRLDIRRIETLKKDGVSYGNKVRVKVVKNKMAPPFKQVALDLIYNEGISHTLDLLDAALLYKVVDKAGSWFSYKDKKLGQGREAVSKALKADKKLFDEIYVAVKDLLDKSNA